MPLIEKFRKALTFTLQSEGGTNSDPIDRGGYTNYGISSKQYPELDIKNLTESEAETIYFNDYWRKNRCYILAENLSIVLFDSSVNCGVPSAAKWMQMSCNHLGSKLVVDGIIGSHTTMEIIKYNPDHLLELIISERLKRYAYLIGKYPEQRKFISGWVTRVSNLLKYVHTVKRG